MGEIVVIGLCNLRTLFGTYQQFIRGFWNDLLNGSVRKSLWNGAMITIIPGLLELQRHHTLEKM